MADLLFAQLNVLLFCAMLLFFLIADFVVLSITPSPSATHNFKGYVRSVTNTKLTLPLTNVTIVNVSHGLSCSPLSQLTSYPDGIFEINCNCETFASSSRKISLSFVARQYDATLKTIMIDSSFSGPNSIQALDVFLNPRDMVGFPATSWRFEGWVVQAETGDVPHTNITFLSHPSAYRTPSGRIFVISTAGALHSQKPGWTQCYWQEKDEVSATGVCNDGKPLIDASHPGVFGSSMSARLIFADNRLLMVTGMEILSQHRRVSILENLNLHDPSNRSEWKGLGAIHVNFTGAPTMDHEDFRLHILEGERHHHYTCNGLSRKYWLLIIPDNAPGESGRACGRMAFASEHLLGPYQWCNYAVNPKGTQCDAFPGDLIFDDVSRQMYFVESYGSVYRGTSNEGPLEFQELPGAKIVRKGPPGSYDDLGDVALTFLMPDLPHSSNASDFTTHGNRWTLNHNRARLYHATYSTVNHNPNVTKKADFGYKLAIGMYTFDWPSQRRMKEQEACQYLNFDLMPWKNIILTAHTNGGKYDVSLCGDLPIKCKDSLTHMNISGKLFSYFGNSNKYLCWDVLVSSFEKPKYTKTSNGLDILFTRRGDAHLSCETIDVNISVRCDLEASKIPEKADIFGHQDGCTWNFNVNSSNSNICK